ncbi:PadR family transcriptional regulator [Mobilisporobacter senegalensis]|uniref:PadR family transcriptional regulator n=1 Tax=Mobilisporobacter senegalensis TaxID=1329262 RepID=A0A3N1XC98_9FIRM|nr:PadR family transcriptional regulator [Mobilisporobacter senegalensis]ROR22387.1 PadR family transcriptional regulator [Mobilisporobacter senegalensis]
MKTKIEPLTESYFYILLCLYNGANHGYGIMQDTLNLSGNRVRIGSGTMYGAVSNMMKKGWIVETKSDNPEDERKRLYKITESGRSILSEEIKRLNELVESANKIIH